MPAAKLLPHEREEVRKAYEQGIGYERLSKEYGVPNGTIRRWACDGKWINPQKLEQAKHAERLKGQNSVISSERLSQPPKAEEVIGRSLIELEERLTLPHANYLVSLLDQTKEKQLLEAPTSLKDYNLAMRLGRTMLGLDKPQVAITISPWGSSSTRIEKDIDAIEAE